MSTPPEAGSGAPPTVVTAYRLYLAAAVLGLIGLAVSLVLLPASIDAAVQEAQRQVQGQDTGGVDVVAVGRGVAIAAATLGGIVAVAFVVLTIVFARTMLRGRNWARIVLAVFAGLRLVGLLGLAGPGASAVLAVLTLLELVAVVVAAVLSFLPASAPWFRRTTLPPAMP